MEYEWKETVEQLRDFVENSKDLIQIIAPDGVLLYANRSWREALGVSGTDYCGRNIFDFLAPECREHCQTLFGRLMRGEDVGLFHVTFLALDGRRVEAEGHVSVRWEQGKPQHTRGIFRDVTEDLRKEAEIRRLALIASLTDNAVVLTDATGRVAWINEGFTRLTGYSLPEVKGRKPGSFLQGPLTDPETVRRMRAHLSAGSGFREELLNYRKDGSTYWVSLEVQAILDQHGRVAS